MSSNEAWLTLRLRTSHRAAAVTVLNKIVRELELESTPTGGQPPNGDWTGHPIVQQLRSGAVEVGTAIVGLPGGGEFDEALH